MKTYENYPKWIVVLSNLQSLIVYGLGFFILFKLRWIWALIYILYVLVLEFRLIKNHCTDCYYWGKACGFGKGKISALFFKKGDPAKFCNMKMSWKDMIPDMLVSLVPIIIGIVLLIMKFDWMLLVAMVVLLLLSTTGSGFIRGKLTCKYCKQKELGCPADQLFNKEK